MRLAVLPVSSSLPSPQSQLYDAIEPPSSAEPEPSMLNTQPSVDSVKDAVDAWLATLPPLAR